MYLQPYGQVVSIKNHLSHIMRKPVLCHMSHMRKHLMSYEPHEKTCLNVIWATSKEKVSYVMWAKSWENLFLPYVNDKAQISLRIHLLISAFVVRCLDSVIPLLAIAEFSRPQLVSSAEQVGLSLSWSQTPKTGFLMMGLIYQQQRCRSAMHFIYEPRHDEKTSLLSLRPGKTQTGLLSYRDWLESWNFGYGK